MRFADKEDLRVGVHGYDNEDPLMHTIFIASGPMFKKKTISTVGISTMEVYSLLKYLLNLEIKASEVQPNREMKDMKQLLLFENEIVPAVITLPIPM